MFSDRDGFIVLQNNVPKFVVVGTEPDANMLAQMESTRTQTPITMWSKLPVPIKVKVADKATSGDVRVEIPRWSDPNYG